jgi:acyl-CoA synthetase (AMP-forming)/AMP-acid ligase II
MNVGRWLTHANCFWTNLSLDRGCELREDDIVLQVLPQFHVGGWNVQPLLAWWKGATTVLEPAFDAARTLRIIAEHRVTTMMGVPATYQFMAQDPTFTAADLSSLRTVIVGGASMPEPLLRLWHDRGVRIAYRGRRRTGRGRLLPDRRPDKDMYVSGGENVYPAEVDVPNLVITSCCLRPAPATPGRPPCSVSLDRELSDTFHLSGSRPLGVRCR